MSENVFQNQTGLSDASQLLQIIGKSTGVRRIVLYLFRFLLRIGEIISIISDIEKMLSVLMWNSN